jgi:hypothetical protein
MRVPRRAPGCGWRRPESVSSILCTTRPERPLTTPRIEPDGRGSAGSQDIRTIRCTASGQACIEIAQGHMLPCTHRPCGSRVMRAGKSRDVSGRSVPGATPDAMTAERQAAVRCALSTARRCSDESDRRTATVTAVTIILRRVVLLPGRAGKPPVDTPDARDRSRSDIRSRPFRSDRPGAAAAPGHSSRSPWAFCRNFPGDRQKSGLPRRLRLARGKAGSTCGPSSPPPQGPVVDFTITPRIEDFRARLARFVADEILPVEARPEASDAHGKIALGWLEGLREKARSEGL